MVLSTPGKLLSRIGRPSLFGDGLLERIRSTSLALLSIVAGIGLMAVAVALSLSWPTPVGQPLPSFPPKRQGVAEKTVVTGADQPRGSHSGGPAAHGDARPGEPLGGGSQGGAIAVTAPTTHVVVSAPTTPRPHTQGGDADSPDVEPPPVGQSQRPSAAPPPVQPTPSPAPSPPPPPEPVAESSDVPGNGNAYGKGNGNGPPSPPPAVGNPHGVGVGGN